MMMIYSPPRAVFNKNDNVMKVIDYFRDTKGELKHVSWPTRHQTIYFTIVVIVISVGTAAFLGFFDFAFIVFFGKIIGVAR